MILQPAGQAFAASVSDMLRIYNYSARISYMTLALFERLNVVNISA
jgi:hypothetical protein